MPMKCASVHSALRFAAVAVSQAVPVELVN